MAPSDRSSRRGPRWLMRCVSWRSPLLMSLVEVGQVYLRSTIGGPPVALGERDAEHAALLAAARPAHAAPGAGWRAGGRSTPRRARGRSPRILSARRCSPSRHAFAVTIVNMVRSRARLFARHRLLQGLELRVVIDVLMYGVIVGATHAFRYYEESRERERQAAALQAQPRRGAARRAARARSIRTCSSTRSTRSRCWR